jgi:lipopolysaccharide transport system ATP-binding protein
MADMMLRVENVSKRYRIGIQDEQPDNLAGALSAVVRRPLQNIRRLRALTHFDSGDDTTDNVIWALKDISFELAQGDVIGFIGPNGSGKSTLLKIISRITPPTSGRVRLRGRVGSLLEVGTGFHPELTGRENIYLNATILGMRKAEVDTKFDEIVDFSGIEQFLDTPIKRYSSGMKVRLAFAVAAHLEPEILIIDEVLAVGDAEFQKKCLGKMSDVAQGGRTVLFVSHNMTAIQRLCQTCMWLNKGQMVQYGNPEEVIRAYQTTVSTRVASVTLPADPEKPMRLRRAEVRGQQQDAPGVVEFSEPVTIELAYDINRPVTSAHVACFLYTADGVCILGSGDADIDQSNLETREPGHYRGCLEITPRLLGEGRYTITITMGVPYVAVYDRHESLIEFEIVDFTSQRRTYQHTRRPGLLGLELPWSVEKCV